MRTMHMEDRMRQRGVSEEMVGAILTLGEWNERGDRIVLSERVVTALLQQIRGKVKMLEKLARRGGASLVVVNEKLITVHTNTKRVRS